MKKIVKELFKKREDIKSSPEYKVSSERDRENFIQGFNVALDVVMKPSQKTGSVEK